MSQNRHHNPVQDYIDQTFAPDDELLQTLRAKGETLRTGIQISAGEGRLLYILAKMLGAKRILELGCFMGYSTIYLARALPEDGELITLESNAQCATLARQHFAQTNLPITLIEGDAHEILPSLEGTFDLIFIDADKISYHYYLKALLPLLRTGGLMVGDNTLLSGTMLGKRVSNISAPAIEAMKAFNEMMADPDLFDGVMIPTAEGMTIGIKR